MRYIELAIRSLNKKGRHNCMKIISLAIGLAVGLVLIAKVCFEQSYDDFYPDANRIYRIYEKSVQNNELKEYPNVPGGTAIRLREIMPEIETSTRLTPVMNGYLTLDDSKRKLSGKAALADSCFFDILSRPILQGDAKETLSRPMYVMISDELAEKIGGDVIGKRFSFDNASKEMLTIGGVFKKFPLNSIIYYDVLISMPSIGNFIPDGSMNLVGNDRYNAFLKLRKGADIASLDAQMEKFVNTYLPVEEMKKIGITLEHTFHPLMDEHSKDKQVKSMVLMLSLVAFALILVAVMNYILIVVSTLVGRSKEVAIRKCYGANEKEIIRLVFAEAFIHVTIALMIAILLLFTFRGLIERLVETPIWDLMLSKSMWILVGACLLILLVTGILPGTLYARIPVASAFRHYRESKRFWKLGLLFIQFMAAGFLISLLFSLNRQYSLLIKDSPGYEFDNLAFASVNSLDSTQRKTVLQELERLPEVAQVTYACSLPFYPTSGNNVQLADDDKQLFNCADQYYVGDRFFEVMGIRLVEGHTFTPNLNRDEEVMISQSFVKKMEETAGWEGSPIGKRIIITEHSINRKALTICSVFKDYRIGTMQTYNTSPIALFYSPKIMWGYYLIKFHQITPEAIQRVEQTLQTIAPDKEIHAYSYKNELLATYENIKNFRDAVSIGGGVILIIVFIGLVGYTTDEVNRRKKEIAIRRINGALLGDVEKIFLGDIAKIALPATLLGIALAWQTMLRWQEQFAEKATLSWIMFAAIFFLIVVVTLAVSAYNVKRIVEDNPANGLKTE